MDRVKTLPWEFIGEKQFLIVIFTSPGAYARGRDQARARAKKRALVRANSDSHVMSHATFMKIIFWLEPTNFITLVRL